MDELVAVLIMILGAGAVVLFLLGLSQWLGPKNRNPVKDEAFECGNIPISLPTERFSVKFYTVAILFVLFDIEIVFLFPWAVVFRDLGVTGLVSMTLFIAVLFLGLIYALKKGVLQWD
ncbi:MAG: NADH-quinone oxidoreductase subunit A [bacterium]